MNIKIKNLAERAGISVSQNDQGDSWFSDLEIALLLDFLRVQLLQELELQRDQIALIDQNDWQRGRDRGIRKSIETVQNFFAEK
jgi:hypothetical protein